MIPAVVPFDELITFLASSPSAEEIIAYHPPEALQARMSELLDKNRQGSLSRDEEAELDEFLRMNRFMSHLRAGHCCEYCLLNQEDIFFAFEVDHIISEKHDGVTIGENFCLSCPDCNLYKGSDIGSIDRETKHFAFV
jgi:5-methylcytosine-specific restriction endonuclease McrA